MSGSLHHVATAQEGLELEARLFDGAAPGALVWTCASEAIVCPASFRSKSRIEAISSVDGLQGWQLTTRPTGGGAVPQGPGILNLAISYTAYPGYTIDDGYALITDILCDGVSWLGTEQQPGDTPGSFCDGAWNLTTDRRKVAGTAQRWRPLSGGRIRILAHALLLVDGDIVGRARAVDALHRHLKLPSVRPEAHATLAEVHGAGIDMKKLAHGICRSAHERLTNEAGLCAAA